LNATFGAIRAAWKSTECGIVPVFVSVRSTLCAETPIHTATVPSTTTSKPSRSENAAQNPLLSFSLAGGLYVGGI
jgi:hypothetical protein